MLEEALDYRRVALLLCWATIFFRAFQNKSFRLFPPFFLYVAVSAASLVASLVGVGIWGAGDPRYLNLYIFGHIVVQATMGYFLIWIITLPVGFRSKRVFPPLLLFLLLSVLVEITFLSSEAHFIWRFSRAGTFFLLLLACLGVYRCLQAVESFQLGYNMGSALAGMLILLFLEFISSGFYLSHLWDYETFGSFFDFAGVVSWGFIAYGNWELDKPKWS